MVLAGDTSRTRSSLNTLTDSLTPFHVRHQSFAKLLLVHLVLLLHGILHTLLLLNCGVILFSRVITLGIGTTFDV